MIPSRPLFLGDIIGTTFTIAAKTWTRSAVAAILFLVIPMSVFLVTATGFVSTVYDALKAEGYLTPQKLERFRQEFVSTLRENNPMIVDLYGLSEEPIAHPESSPPSEQLLPYEETPEYDAVVFAEKYGDSFDEYIFWGVIGYILLIIALLGYQVAAIDLASREFEERKLYLWRAIRDSLASYLWINILQFLILIFVLMFGLGVAIQVGSLLPAPVGGFIMLGAIIMTVITAIRSLFAQPALVSENLGPLNALKRSWELTRGHTWRVFGTLIAFAAITIVVYLILSIPMTAITTSSTQVFFNFLRGTEVNAAHIFNSLNDLFVEIVLSLMITTTIFASLSPSFLTVLYYDLRTRKDGPLVYDDEQHPEQGS